MSSDREADSGSIDELVVYESRVQGLLIAAGLLSVAILAFAAIPGDAVFQSGRLSRLSGGAQDAIAVACGLAGLIGAAAMATHKPRVLLTLRDGELTTFTAVGDPVSNPVRLICTVSVVSPDEVPTDQKRHGPLATSILRSDFADGSAQYVDRTRPLSHSEFLRALGHHPPPDSLLW